MFSHRSEKYLNVIKHYGEGESSGQFYSYVMGNFTFFSHLLVQLAYESECIQVIEEHVSEEPKTRRAGLFSHKYLVLRRSNNPLFRILPNYLVDFLFFFLL